MKAETGVRLRSIKAQIERNDQEKAIFEHQKAREERVRQNRTDGIDAIWPRFVEAISAAVTQVHSVTSELDPPLLLEVRESTFTGPHAVTLVLTRKQADTAYTLVFEADENGSVAATYKSPDDEGVLGQFEVYSASTDVIDAALLDFLSSYADDEKKSLVLASKGG